jgi:flagellar basal body-associated protein FliL
MSRPIRLIEKALVAIIVFLVFIIVATTVWALVFRNGSGHGEMLPADNVSSDGEVAEQNFTGIGRLRSVLKGEQGRDGPTVIIRVVFPYNAADTAFTEELAEHIGFFRETVGAYFSTITASDPKLHDETTIKADLLNRFNAGLRLGKIERLFFSEFLIID